MFLSVFKQGCEVTLLSPFNRIRVILSDVGAVSECSVLQRHTPWLVPNNTEDLKVSVQFPMPGAAFSFSHIELI